MSEKIVPDWVKSSTAEVVPDWVNPVEDKPRPPKPAKPIEPPPKVQPGMQAADVKGRWASPKGVTTPDLRGQPSLTEGAQALGGTLEAPLAMATGALGGVIGGAIGAGRTGLDLLQGQGLAQSMETGEQARKQASDALTYQPRTQSGKAIVQALAAPMEMSSSGLGQLGSLAGKTLGNEALGTTIGENLNPALQAITGVKGLAGAGLSPKKTTVTTVPGSNVLPHAQDAIARMKAIGYEVPPVEANPSRVNKAATLVAGGPTDINNVIALRNAKRTADMVKSDIGLSPDKYINDVNLKQLSESQFPAYEKVRNSTGHVDVTDPQFVTALANVDQRMHALKQTYPTLGRQNALEVIRAELQNPLAPLTPDVALETIRRLREKADTKISAAQIGSADMGDGLVIRGAANAMEDLLDRSLPPGVVADYRVARQKLAKINNVRATTNLQTGHVYPEKLTAMKDAGEPLSGGLEQIADAHKAIPKVVKNTEHLTPGIHVHAGDVGTGTIISGGLGAAMGLALSGPAGAAAGAGGGTALARVIPSIARGTVSSEWYQNKMANVPPPKPKYTKTIKRMAPLDSADVRDAFIGAASTLPPPMQEATEE